MPTVVSYQIADSIDVKGLRTAYKEGIYLYDADELFYKTGEGCYVYVFKYGVVCFMGYSDAEAATYLERVGAFSKNLFQRRLSEEFDVETNAQENKFGYNKIEITKPDIDVIRLIMLNVSQSVALDYYSEQTDMLQEEANSHMLTLERKGRLRISGAALKKYIGKTLRLKSRISENLYIFDSPPETWEDENLNRIDQGLKRTFDLQERYRDIREGLEIIGENLDLFKDLLQYRNSTVLEWIVIVLIALELLNLIIDKLFHL